jgi:hypothetical protein
MFNIFKKKSKSEKLQEKYNKLMSDWHKLSTINRSKSDEKYAQAQLVLQEIEIIQNK